MQKKKKRVKDELKEKKRSKSRQEMTILPTTDIVKKRNLIRKFLSVISFFKKWRRGRGADIL